MKITPHVLAATALFAVGTGVAHAASTLENITTYIPLTTLPGVFTAGEQTNPVAIIKGFYGLAIGAGSIIAVVMIVLAGFKYMYEESISGKSGAKEQIENAFLGLLVILGSYILLRTVNADLVNFNPILPGGTGALSKLVAQDQALKALQNQLHQAALDRTTRLQAINTLTTTLAEQDGQIVDLQSKIALEKKKPQTAETAAAIADYQNQIAALETKRETTKNVLITKKTEDFAQTDVDSLTAARQMNMSQEVSRMEHFVNDNPNEYYLPQIKTSMDTLSKNTDLQINSVKSRLNQAAALIDDRCSDCEATVSENIVGTYSEKVSKDLEYLNASKNMIESVKTSGDNFSGYDVQNRSLAFDKIVADTNKKATELESAGRKDLADNLRADMDKVTKIVVTANRSLCSNQSKDVSQQVSLCKQ